MFRFDPIRLAALAALALALGGCGIFDSGDDGEESDPLPPGPSSTTFTIGGTVTGLTGTVVLRLNGGNDETVNAPGGTFTFDTGLANGASYVVSVAAQPAGQVCGPNVTNGTGTIGGANVTNVAIACASYSVGGTVSGLTGSGLVLELNGESDGATDLDVPLASASFTFPSSAPLAGIAYSIRIKTQPDGQTCTIVDALGLVTASAPDGTTAEVVCVDNETDALSGTYRVQSVDGQAVDARAFMTFQADGTYIFGLHEDDPDCGPSNGNGLEYGVYRWHETTHAFSLPSVAIDTNGECGIANDGDPGAGGTLVVRADGTLVSDTLDTDGSGNRVLITWAPVPSVADTLVGSWGDNLWFTVYADDGTFFAADTRALVQIAEHTPGVEDGCYALTGTLAAGSFTTDLSAACTVGGTQAADSTGAAFGLSSFASAARSFTVTGDTLQFTLAPALEGMVSAARIPFAPDAPSTFTVSGTVTGLTSGSVVLRLNGVHDEVVGAPGGAFSFDAGLDDGATYTVIIVGQPGGQICGPGVVNGTGTIGGADVTNLTVACADYRIGGSVTGLQGDLTLRLNDEHDLAVGAGAGEFEFLPEHQVYIPVYNIHVQQQPAGQTCTIVDAVGVVSAVQPIVDSAHVECVDNVTDPLAGTYQLRSAESDARIFVTFHAEGTFIAGFHADEPVETCGSTRGNGVQYGVYDWDQAANELRIVRHALDTVSDGAVSCGFDVTDDDEPITLFVQADGTLVGEDFMLVPVPSVPGTLIGSWGDDQAFIAYDALGRFFLASTRPLLGVPPPLQGFPGVEDGCYALTGSTSAGSYGVDLGHSCGVSGTLTGLDTTGPIELSQFVGLTLDFVVTGDVMETTVDGVPAPGFVGFVPGTRVPVATPAADAPTFSVGGTLTGLDADGLQLRLNGQAGADFNVSPSGGDGQFQFAAQLPAGAPYSITLVSLPTTPVTQFCGVAGAAGTVFGADVDVTVTCFDSAPYTVGGNVAGLAAGRTVSLRLSYFLPGGVPASTDLDVTANGAFQFPPGTIPASSQFALGLAAQPDGQTCTITRALGFSLGMPVMAPSVACVDNVTDPLSGTYSLFDPDSLSAGRAWFNFNPDGTFTVALVHRRPEDRDYAGSHDGEDCNEGIDFADPSDPLNRWGNGVEYGVYTWDEATGLLHLPVLPAIDTNGECGFSDGDWPLADDLFISRVGDAIVLLGEDDGATEIEINVPAVESIPLSLVGAFVPEGGGGGLLVFHADGTFLWVETQQPGLFPLGYGQERGCYEVDEDQSLVRFSGGDDCRPDGRPAYDLNGPGGLLPNVAAPVPFTFHDPDTLEMLATTFKRTAPN